MVKLDCLGENQRNNWYNHSKCMVDEQRIRQKLPRHNLLYFQAYLQVIVLTQQLSAVYTTFKVKGSASSIGRLFLIKRTSKFAGPPHLG